MLADESKLSAWFVMDHDSAFEDARNSTKGRPELHETWVARPKLRHVPMGVSRRSPAFAAALASRTVPFHARNGSVYVNFRVHGLNRATAKSVVQKNFGVKNAYSTSSVQISEKSKSNLKTPIKTTSIKYQNTAI